MSTESPDGSSLKIIHVLRAPLGGLFRHVIDLAREQVARGHKVGLIADSLTGGDRATKILNELAPSLELGLSRVPMHRNPHVSDIAAVSHVISRVRAASPDIVHGHGSKGAFYGALPASHRIGRPIGARLYATRRQLQLQSGLVPAQPLHGR